MTKGDFPDNAAFPEGGFLPADGNAEAIDPQPETTLDVLKDIRTLLRNQQEETPADNWETRVITLDATANTTTLDNVAGFKYVYVDNVPRTVRLYAGLGTTFRLAQATVGKRIKATLPKRATALTVEWDGGVANEQIIIQFSTDDLTVEVQ